MGVPLEKFAEEAKHIKKIGYDCVDLQQYINPESSFYSLSDDVIVAAKNTLNKNGLIVNQLHGPWAWPPPNNTAEERDIWLKKHAKQFMPVFYSNANIWLFIL